MLDRILMIFLGPVLLTQGKQVRNNTPFLPEPPGDRTGASGQGPLLRLLVVGDSSAAGVGADHQDQALLGQTVSRLAANYRVEYRLVAATGSTTRGAVRRLNSLPSENFDVVVTALGANDSTRLLTVDRFLADQAQLMTVLKEKFGAGCIICSGLPPMHIFPAMPQPLRWVIGRRANKLNRALAQWLATQDRCHFLNSDFAADVELMAADGFHPGPAAYEIWGEAVAEHIGKLLADGAHLNAG